MITTQSDAQFKERCVVAVLINFAEVSRSMEFMRAEVEPINEVDG